MTNAHTQYLASIIEARDLLNELANAIDQHQVREADSPRNYGHVGDLTETNRALREAIRFLNGDA